MILFRCDLCGKETPEFWNLAIVRKRCKGTENVTVEKTFAFDVCSGECERRAISKVLSVVVPIARPHTSESEGGSDDGGPSEARGPENVSPRGHS